MSFLLEEDRARAFTLRTPIVDARAALARHLVHLDTPHTAGGPDIANLATCGQPTLAPAPAPAPVSSAAQRAANYASSTLSGQVYANPTDTALFPASDWAPGPLGEWSGDCAKLVSTAWTHATATATTCSAATPSTCTTTTPTSDASRAARRLPGLVFYNLTSAGHVALSVGGGQIVTTHGLDFNREANSTVSYGYFGSYLGWTMP